MLAIEDIWQEYQSALTGFLKRHINNAADVDDLLQDILLKTYQQLHTLKTAEKVKPWLFQIANRTIIDFYRKRGVQEKHAAESLWYEQDSPSVLKELSDCMQPFLQGLPKEAAELLQAIEIDGMSQKVFAEQHGIKYSTLKSKVQKSRKALNHVVNNCCQLAIDSRGRISDYQPKGCSTC